MAAYWQAWDGNTIKMEEVQLGEVLKEHRLETYVDALKDLGVNTVQDLQDLEAPDLMTMGMTKIEQNRFWKMVNPSATPSVCSDTNSTVSAHGFPLQENIDILATPHLEERSLFGLKYIVLQQADTFTVCDYLDILDPNNVTMKDIVDFIVHREEADPNSTTAELYTKEGISLTNDPFLMNWSIQRHGITNGTLLFAVLCRIGLKVCRLLPQNGEKTPSPLNPYIEDCHTLQCQLESGETYLIKLNLEEHNHEDLKFKIEEAIGIPTSIQHIRVPSSALNCSHMTDGEPLSKLGIDNNGIVVVCPQAKPDTENPTWQLNFSSRDVTPLVEQTDKGMQIFASVLYVVAEKKLDKKLLGLIRKLTCWSPLIAALHTLYKRVALITAEKVAIVEGLYYLFRRILQKSDVTAACSSTDGIGDDLVFEYSAECWAYLLTKCVDRDEASEVYKEVSLMCAHSQNRLVHPVRVGDSSCVYNSDAVHKSMKAGTQLTSGHPTLIDEADITPALDVQTLLICNPDKERVFMWDMNTGPTLPDNLPEWIGNRSAAELNVMLRSNHRLLFWPPLQIKAVASDPPWLTLNNKKQAVVFTGYSKDAAHSSTLYNPWWKEAHMFGLDQLARDLKDVKFSTIVTDCDSVAGFTRTPLEAIVVLLDTSTSMTLSSFGTTLTKMEAVKELFYAFADRSIAYNFPHLIGLTTFTAVVAVRGECTELFEKFKDDLSSVTPSRGTAIFHAITEAVQQLKKVQKKFPNCKRRILCLTDGEDQHSSVSALQAVQLLLAENIVLDAIELRTPSPWANYDLKCCSFASGGQCFNPESLSEGRKIFEMETILSIKTREPSTNFKSSIGSQFELQSLSTTPYTTQVAHTVPKEIKKPVARAYAVLQKAAKDKMLPALKTADRSKRIMRELSALARDPHPAFSVYPSEENIGFWRIMLVGATDTPYAGGVFSLYIEFPENYPVTAPTIRFVTPIYHCNINTIGRICHSVFDRNYTSDTRVKTILSCVYGLMMTPEPKDPLDGVLAEEYFTNKALYNLKAEQWTKKHASNTLEQCEKTLLSGSTLPVRPLPSILVCPLTKQLFVDPVQTPHGHVYERHAIENHLKKKSIDPIANEPLKMGDLVSAVTVKRQVAEYRSNQVKVKAWW